MNSIMDHKMELGAIAYCGWVDIPCTDVERIQRDERYKDAIKQREKERESYEARRKAMLYERPARLEI